MKKLIRIGLITAVIICGCQSNQQKNKQPQYFEKVTKEFRLPDTNTFGGPIFSNMYLNVELAEFFQKADDEFHGEYLHEISPQSRHLTTATKAIKLGVYAVDFNYTRMYDQIQESEHYLRTVVNYASSLGIPHDFSKQAVHKIENSIADADSFEHIANDVYTETVRFLKMNDNEYAIALVVIGGWTEAMYIAARMMEVNGYSDEYVELYLKQSTSLEEIIKIAAQFGEFEEVKELINRLMSLHDLMENSYEIFEDGDDYGNMLDTTLEEIISLRQYLVQVA
ncbi:MAG: hypothetical protein GVY19_03250 [Bacteroidetes bacterium]|jgi:hypothetical protein|nr:hypothetical protein [Bacteroidota bacterium]